MKIENGLINVNDKNRLRFVEYVYENGEDIFKILEMNLEKKIYIENIFQDLIIKSYELYKSNSNLNDLIIKILEDNKFEYKYRLTLRIQESDVKEDMIKVRKMNLRKEKIIQRFVLEEIKEKFSLKEEEIIYKNMIITLNNFNFRDYNGVITTTMPDESIVFSGYIMTREKIYRLDLKSNYEDSNYEEPYFIESFENIKEVKNTHGILRIVFKNNNYILLRTMKDYDFASYYGR